MLTFGAVKPNYTNLSYIVPEDHKGPIFMAGLGVTDNGFGVWNYTLQVVAKNGTTKRNGPY
jgi:hypothetical protein